MSLAAYREMFTKQGWDDKDLKDAVIETMQHETGYGRMPPAAKFVEHFKARRQREEDEALMATPEYAELVRCEADRLEARRVWARIPDPSIRAQSFKWAYSTEKLAARLKELGYEQ
jgi:hypothetical protein